jgi:Spy/CpxP family protein refolding chaperone
MKSRFALLAMMVVAAAPLAAQGGGGGGGRRGGGGRGGMDIEQMTTQYNLSSDQKTKATALIKIYTDGTAATQTWMASERAAGAAQNVDSMKKISDARAKFNADFKALLTPDQAKTFDSVQTAQQGRRRGGGGGR